MSTHSINLVPNLALVHSLTHNSRPFLPPFLKRTPHCKRLPPIVDITDLKTQITEIGLGVNDEIGCQIEWCFWTLNL